MVLRGRGGEGGEGKGILHNNLVFINWVDNVNWPPWRDSLWQRANACWAETLAIESFSGSQFKLIQLSNQVFKVRHIQTISWFRFLVKCKALNLLSLMFVIYVNRNYFFSGPCQCELLYLTTPHESLSFVAGKNWWNFLAKFAKTYFVCLFVVSI